MKRGWWSLKDTEKLDPLKCLVFPHGPIDSLDENDHKLTSDDIDLETFDSVITSTIPLNDVDREHIVTLVKQGCYSGEVIQE